MMLLCKNKTLLFIIILFSGFLFYYPLYSQDRANIIVAQDGTGNFKTITEALNAAPHQNDKTFIILVKNGTYAEKLFITKSNIAIVGENRDSTKIVFAELRRNWIAQEGKTDWGSGTINIDSAVVGFTLANLTVHNNYGSLFGDHDHQFAIRGWGTKIIFLNCNIIADGGDTVALWNPNGMYYHSNCYFEGWVDYVCPQGWCYITDSKFYGHNLSASLWHNGSVDKNQKLVIRYSYFDGTPGFPLGRHHRDAQFYLLDCIFSENLADVPIYWPVSPNAKEWIWGERHYFYNCHRIGGDYDWFNDNLEEAETSPNANSINAKWTFDGKWNPKNEMTPHLPFVSLPQPRNGSYFNAEKTILRWVPSRNAVSFKIYFWKSIYPQVLKRGEKLKTGTHASGEPIFIRNQKENYFNPGKLDPSSTYYWRIDEMQMDGSVKAGMLWHFTTK
jgi:pectinesterase